MAGEAEEAQTRSHRRAGRSMVGMVGSSGGAWVGGDMRRAVRASTVGRDPPSSLRQRGSKPLSGAYNMNDAFRQCVASSRVPSLCHSSHEWEGVIIDQLVATAAGAAEDAPSTAAAGAPAGGGFSAASSSAVSSIHEFSTISLTRRLYSRRFSE